MFFIRNDKGRIKACRREFCDALDAAHAQGFGSKVYAQDRTTLLATVHKYDLNLLRELDGGRIGVVRMGVPGMRSRDKERKTRFNNASKSWSHNDAR